MVFLLPWYQFSKVDIWIPNMSVSIWMVRKCLILKWLSCLKGSDLPQLFYIQIKNGSGQLYDPTGPFKNQTSHLSLPSCKEVKFFSIFCWQKIQFLLQISSTLKTTLVQHSDESGIQAFIIQIPTFGFLQMTLWDMTWNIHG